MKLRTLFGLALLGCSLSSFGATTGNLILKGVVDARYEISVSSTADALSLNILGGASNLKIATVSEISNNRTGYKISMKSDNAGKLVDSLDSSKYSSYKLKYNGVEYTPTTSFAVVKTVTSLSGLTINNSDVLINLTANPGAVAGSYQDAVYFSIEAN